MGGEVSVKLPFTLTHSCINEAPTDSVIEEATHKMILEGKENSADEDDDKEDNLKKDKENNNGDEKSVNNTLSDDTNIDAKSPDEHVCVTDVVVNIENNASNRTKRTIEESPSKINAVKPDEELDLIVKYPGPDTWSDEELGETRLDEKTEQSNGKRDSIKHEITVKSNCKSEVKYGFAENLKRAVCCIDRRRQS